MNVSGLLSGLSMNSKRILVVDAPTKELTGTVDSTPNTLVFDSREGTAEFKPVATVLHYAFVDTTVLDRLDSIKPKREKWPPKPKVRQQHGRKYRGR